MATMNAVEWLIQRNILKNTNNNKAKASRILYQAPNEILPNASSKFSEREKLLMKNIKKI